MQRDQLEERGPRVGRWNKAFFVTSTFLFALFSCWFSDMGKQTGAENGLAYFQNIGSRFHTLIFNWKNANLKKEKKREKTAIAACMRIQKRILLLVYLTVF